MEKDTFSQFTKIAGDAYKNWQELGGINTKAVQKLTELQFELASLNVEGGLKQAALLSSIHNEKDFAESGREFVGSYTRKVLDVAKKAIDIMNGTRDELSVWVEDTMNAAKANVDEQVKKTVRKS